jgi:hypothetical protein
MFVRSREIQARSGCPEQVYRLILQTNLLSSLRFPQRRDPAMNTRQNMHGKKGFSKVGPARHPIFGALKGLVHILIMPVARYPHIARRA